MNKKLIDIVDIKYGYAFDSSQFSDNSNYPPLVRIRDVKRGYSETYYEGSIPEGYDLSKNDLLIGMDGEFNIARWQMETGLLNQRVCKITVKDGYDGEYLRFFLLKELKKIENKTDAVTVKHLSAKELNKINLNIPTYNEQNKISKTLVDIERIIQLKNNELTLLDMLVKSRFIELFENEKNKSKLIELCRFINGDRGKNYPSGNDIVESGVPFINAGHLEDNKILFNEMNYLTEEKFNVLNSGKVQKDDILYCLRGSLGKKALVEIDKGAIASSLVILRPNRELIIPKFLLYSLEQPYVIEQMKKANNGSSQPNLSAQSVKDYEILLPSLDKQLEFEKFVEKVDKSKLVIQQSLDKYQQLFDSLMQEYFG